MLKDKIKDMDIDFSANRMNNQQLGEYEKHMDVVFGEQLSDYITEFGYLGYEFIEFYGINATQGLNSDMVTTTKWLHSAFPQTKGLTAIEDQGDGDYYLADENDNIFRFLPSNGELTKTQLKFNDYVLARFNMADSLK